MEEVKKPSLIKSTVNYGVMLGLALVIYSLLLWMFDATFNQSLGYVSFAITIGGIIFATRAYRDQELGGYISYGQALGVGTLTVLFSGIITALFTLILYNVIDTGLAERNFIILEEAYYAAGMSDEQIDAALMMARRFANPAIMAVMGIIGSVFFGFIFSLVTSAFLKKEGNIFEEDYLSED
jgi:hypothetical protein